MKVRIKFSKQGPVKFIGHLDIMRYFQKAMRRADVDIKYSEGFSPHQIMSFASPLGLGLTSNGEYMDIEVNSLESCEKLTEQLNEVMVEGIRIVSSRILSDQSKNAMSQVAAADYTITFREGKEPEDLKAFFEGIPGFMEQKEILVLKKTKRGERETNIRPSIYEFREKDGAVFIKAAAGSACNVKPELIMEAYYQYLGLSCPEFALMVQREEIYGGQGEEPDQILTPLEQLGVISE